jgi:hypothetical protein
MSTNQKNAKIWNSWLYAAVFLIAFPLPAYAYIDPGSGSYLFQLLAATLLGGLYAVKIYWRGIVTFVGKLFSGRKQNGAPRD